MRSRGLRTQVTGRWPTPRGGMGLSRRQRRSLFYVMLKYLLSFILALGRWLNTAALQLRNDLVRVFFMIFSKKFFWFFEFFYSYLLGLFQIKKQIRVLFVHIYFMNLIYFWCDEGWQKSWINTMANLGRSCGMLSMRFKKFSSIFSYIFYFIYHGRSAGFLLV